MIKKGWSHPTPAVVEVLWQDAVTSHGWGDRKDRLHDTASKTGEIRTAGYLVSDDRDGVRVTISLNAVDDIGDTLMVPRSYIKEVRTLREAEEGWKD